MTELTALGAFTRTAERSANEVIAAYSSSFGLASRLLGSRHRQHIRNVYALVRVADEIVDGVAAEAGLSLEEQRDALARFRAETLHALACGYSPDIVVHAFAVTARASAMEPNLITAFFDAMAMDLDAEHGERTVYDERAHAAYVFGSAQAVGLMCLRVFMRDRTVDAATERTLDDGARSLGAAFQDVNFLRDIADDDKRGRDYLTNGRGVTDEVKAEWVASIRTQLEAADRAIALLPKDARAAVRCAHDVFASLVTRIDSTRAEELYERRVRVPGVAKAAIAVRARVTTALERS